MVLIFHILTAITLALVIAQITGFSIVKKRTLFLGVVLGIMSHGILDVLPHQYPIKAAIDITISIIAIVTTLIFLKDSNQRKVIIACFVGVALPDLIDLGPGMINTLLGTTLPTIRVFPWHGGRYGGSIFDNSQTVLSHTLHAAVFSINLVAILYLRHKEKDSEKRNGTSNAIKMIIALCCLGIAVSKGMDLVSDKLYERYMSNNEIIITGKVLPGGKERCPMDGICSIIVGDYEVITGVGWPKEVRGEREDEIILGDKVEVYGRKFEKAKTMTIYGKREYYIKKVQ